MGEAEGLVSVSCPVVAHAVFVGLLACYEIRRARESAKMLGVRGEGGGLGVLLRVLFCGAAPVDMDPSERQRQQSCGRGSRTLWPKSPELRDSDGCAHHHRRFVWNDRPSVDVVRWQGFA